MVLNHIYLGLHENNFPAIVFIFLILAKEEEKVEEKVEDKKEEVSTSH